MSRVTSMNFKDSKAPRTSSKAFGGYMTDVPKTAPASFSKSTTRKTTTAERLSSSGAPWPTLFSSKPDMANIEGEYIKNLQQQVYFLELEANYLREQARKATDMHPKMSGEAERMLNKLRTMQAEMDGLCLEMKRKESSLDVAHVEKNRLVDQLTHEEASFQREKRLMTDEVVSVRREKEAVERDLGRREAEVSQYQQHMDRTVAQLKSSEEKVALLKSQMDQRAEQHKLTQLALEEKRSEQLTTHSQLKELEDKYYSSTVVLHDKQLDDMRDELRFLRQKLKETELSADQDRYLRTKMTDDSSHMVKENALLSQQVIELQRQLDRERSLRESWDSKRSQNVTDLVTTKEREKQLEFELQQLRGELKHEKERVHHYMQQVSKTEQVASGLELSSTTMRSRVTELESHHSAVDNDNAQLRRDKMLLVDHTAELQSQLHRKEEEIMKLQSQVRLLEADVKETSHLKGLQASFQSNKWEEFERLADSMKNLSRSMALTQSGAGQLPA